MNRQGKPVPGAAMLFATFWGAMGGAFAGPWGLLLGLVLGAAVGHMWRPDKKTRRQQ